MLTYEETDSRIAVHAGVRLQFRGDKQNGSTMSDECNLDDMGRDNDGNI
jgi:hypothetical protein